MVQNLRVCVVFILFIGLFVSLTTAETQIDGRLALNDVRRIPDGFPCFEVPGLESDLAIVRQMFYHHYLFFPGATYNDGYVVRSIIWPDTGTDQRYSRFRTGVRKMLSERRILPDGYVSTMQHIGLAHPEGWPFPFWIQSNGIGWHFSNDDVDIWTLCGIHQTETTDGWSFDGLQTKQIEPKQGLHIELTENKVVITSPSFSIKGLVSPFWVLHWHLHDFSDDAIFYAEWKTEKQPSFNPQRRRYFSVDPSNASLQQTYIPLYPLLNPEDQLTQVRIIIENAKGAKIELERMFSAVDTRHACNNLVWLQGCTDYINWTGDLNFLRHQIQRLRQAMRFTLDEFSVEKEKCISVPWLNNDGRSGIGYDEEGRWYARHGHGLGGGYFDLIPYGQKDGWNTILLYDVLLRMAELEEQILAHPQWNIPGGFLRLQPAYLRDLAAEVKTHFQKVFWNPKTGRFVMNVDRDGNSEDYGFLYYNLEAVYYGLANNRQARTIYDWIDGKRIVEGDTSQGKDIYYWRFAPRATTKRNVDYYSYVWMPKAFAWGDQVQDGGAVLAWSYYDLMNRLRLNGPQDAWNRMQEIIKWFTEVQAEGGYRAYYAKPDRGLMQGGGQAGGLGLDAEFLESIMVPQVMIYGFMGVRPSPDKLSVHPQLPSDWPKLTISGIRWKGRLINLTCTKQQVTVSVQDDDADSLDIHVPKGWTAQKTVKEKNNDK